MHHRSITYIYIYTGSIQIFFKNPHVQGYMLYNERYYFYLYYKPILCYDVEPGYIVFFSFPGTKIINDM